MILALLACASPTWTSESALSPFLRTLDTNGDGKVTREEARMKAESFDALDGDDDGAVEVGELEASLRINDPDTWAQGVMRPSAEMAAMMRQERLGDRSAGWMLQVLVDEVVAKDPNADVPTREELTPAARAGWGSPEWNAAADRIAAAWAKAGMSFPEAVRR